MQVSLPGWNGGSNTGGVDRLVRISGGADLIVPELRGRHDVHPVTVELLGKLTARLGSRDVGFCLVQRHENMVGAELAQASAEGLVELHETVADALRLSAPSRCRR
ncbi:hypothetical protein ABZX92_23735 [Lentzea sp. NPDC006480]|uniref:hypothetical protein n=1 Tax=Lentzea sp. NPDC006480 TaxID=3157176 RepID=UPI0033AE4881